MRGLKHFNSHAHVERDLYSNGCYSSIAYFNSHAHVERDYKATPDEWENKISTHTLTWSVTNSCLECHKNKKISTHTLTWSVTYAYILSYKATSISTHTLTWSVTTFVNVL